MIPLLLVNDKIISNFSEKASLFNKFFTSQCTPLENNSFLPPFCLKTEKSLSSLEISETDIFAIIKNLDPNKSRHNGIPGLWTQELDAGLWTLNSRRWTLVAGLWTLDAVLWTLDATLGS